MILLSPRSSSSLSFTPSGHRTSNTTSRTKRTYVNTVSVHSQSSPTSVNSEESKTTFDQSPLCGSRFCTCGRRLFMKGVGTALFPIYPSDASNLYSDDPMAVLKRVHPPRPDWYEELYASVINTSMKSHESEMAGYKSQLFSHLRAKASKILEIGIGTGPNLKYYATDKHVHVFGIDPNRKMEKYAEAAADAAGLPSANFKFIQAVAESLPLSDASVDAVVGTLVLCSVKDVDMALQEVRRVLKPGGLYVFVEHVAAEDGTILRFVQGLLDPLQQTLADGCHLTRKTGKSIYEAGFSAVDIKKAFLASASLINPHAYGIACK